MCVSAITEAEIRYGLAKRPEAIALRNLLDAFLTSLQVLPWSGTLWKLMDVSGPSLNGVV